MEKFYHIQCSPGDVGKYVFLPGDPGRTDLIAQYFDKPKLVANNREFRSWTGYLDGIKVSVCSTGIGQASTAIAIEELRRCGSDTFIRVGTAGRLAPKAKDPLIGGVICSAAVRDEGLTQEYVPIEYPAVAHYEVLNALVAAGKKMKANYLVGIAHSKESFYGQMEPESIPIGKELISRWNVWEKSNVLCAEMETSTLFTLSSIYDLRAGAIMCFENMEETIQIAITAIRNLIKEDQEAL